MSKVSVDCGGSTLDICFWDSGRMLAVNSFEKIDVSEAGVVELVEEVAQNLGVVAEQGIIVTGGRTRDFKEECLGFKFQKIDEILAIGYGGKYLNDQGDEPFLAVSLGTGTCMVKVAHEKCEHIGGTGVGGGTFLGLCKSLLGETDLERLKLMFKSGNRAKVDLTVKDIVGRKIGIVDEMATASNLGKLVREIDFSKADLASGIVNLVGQTLATTIVFAAKASAVNRVILGGKLTAIEQVVDLVLEGGRFYGVEIEVPKNAAHLSAIGAGFFDLMR